MTEGDEQSSSYRSKQQLNELRLVSYVPVGIVQRHARLELPEPPVQPQRETFPAAIGFVDVSGFTALSEKLRAEHARQGAELLNQYMNSFFERLIEQVAAYGGDVVKFAGDALQVVWRMPEGQEDETDAEAQLGSLVLLASRCCLHLLRTLNNFSPVPGVSLTLHMGIGAGDLDGFTLGGCAPARHCCHCPIAAACCCGRRCSRPSARRSYLGRWEYFVAGEPIAQMSDAAEVRRR